MKMLSKSAIVLAILAVCLPAHGEIIIYRKTMKCLMASEEDGLWDVDEGIYRGYLVLDVTYDSNGAISEIQAAEQIYYESIGRNKWFWQEEHWFQFAGIDLERGFLWVLMEKDSDEGGGEILVITGKAKDTRIGLGKDEPREVAKAIKGDILADWIIGEGIVQMCTISLRLQSRWTKRANDENEGDQDFEYAVFDIVKAYLENRGYRHLT